jgi:hypothetical protein
MKKDLNVSMFIIEIPVKPVAPIKYVALPRGITMK